MKELGVITILGFYEPLAHPSWHLGSHKCGIIFFRCPNADHDHLNVIRVSKNNPISDFEGDKYKNIWKLTREDDGRLSISPSILQEDDFHCGIPTYFQLVDKEMIYEQDKEVLEARITMVEQVDKWRSTDMADKYTIYKTADPIEVESVSIKWQTLSIVKEAFETLDKFTSPDILETFEFTRAFPDEQNDLVNFFSAQGEQLQVVCPGKRQYLDLVEQLP